MLNDLQIREYCIESELIYPFDEDQLQPHSYDCRLGTNFKVPNPAEKGHFLNVDIPANGHFDLAPHMFVLAHTVEVVTVPLGVVGFCAGRSSIARNGLIIESAGLLDAGFSGQVTLELFNQTCWTLKLDAGLKICQVYFDPSEESKIKFYSKIGHYNKQTGARPPVFPL